MNCSEHIIAHLPMLVEHNKITGEEAEEYRIHFDCAKTRTSRRYNRQREFFEKQQFRDRRGALPE